MTAHQIKLVQDSFILVSKIPAETIGEIFYGRLFEIAPEVKPLFAKSDMKQQSRKLLAMLGYIVNRLNHLEEIKNDIRAMAKRHVSYGVKAEQFMPVGQSLLFTLQKGLDSLYTAELANAWTDCYNILSAAMKEAMQHSNVQQ